MSEELITVDTFRVKRALRDPAFYVASAPLVALVSPELAEYVSSHKEALIPMLLFLVGHFVVRTGAVVGLGNFASTLPAASSGMELDVDQILRELDEGDEGFKDE